MREVEAGWSATVTQQQQQLHRSSGSYTVAAKAAVAGSVGKLQQLVSSSAPGKALLHKAIKLLLTLHGYEVISHG